MRPFTSLTSALLATLLLVCTPVFSDSLTNDAVEAELISFNDRFNDIAANYDTDAFISLYSEDALWIAPGKAAVQGLETPTAAFQFLVGNEGKLTHTIDNMFISEDGLQAVMIGKTAVKIEKLELDATGTYLFVLKRTDDEWKIVTDMFNQHASE